MVGSTIRLGYHLLPVLQHWDIFLPDLLSGSIGGRGCWSSIALRTRDCLGIRGSSIAGGEKSLDSFTNHYARAVEVVRRAMNRKGWDLACIVAFYFICATDDSVTIHFHRKRCLSVSTAHATRSRNREAKKVASLKYFEVRNIQEKEPEINDQTYQADWHGHLPKA
jgi:hypothetical protein